MFYHHIILLFVIVLTRLDQESELHQTNMRLAITIEN